MKLENNLYTKNITRSHSQRVEERGLSLRKKTLLLIFIALAFLSFIFIKGSMINDDTLAVDFANKLKAPTPVGGTWPLEQLRAFQTRFI